MKNLYFFAAMVLAGSLAANEPALPNVCQLSTYMPDTSGYIRKTVGPSGKDYSDLQLAINDASLGTVLVLEAGASFIGNYTIPEKITGKGWIVFVSSRMDLLPVADIRINPSGSTGNGTFPTQADAMPKIVTTITDGALITNAKAHHYWFSGIEFAVAPGTGLNYGLVRLGDPENTQNTLAVVPHHIGLDRCYIHGNTTGDLSRGVALNSASTVIVNCYISECHGVGFDTQAIGGWNGPGPYRINNNYLEGAGENILFGGSDPYIPNLVHSDIEIKNNLMSKPLSWWTLHASYAGKHWTVKNIFELKNARRVLVEGNIFENCWTDGQAGVPILFTPRNQYGSAPWSVVEDVTFINNIIRHVPSVINILGRDYNHPSEQTKRIRIANNICYDVDRTYWQGNGTFVQVTESKDITVDHNTVLHIGNTISAYGTACENFIFTNNLFAEESYGVNGDNVGYGNAAISTYFPDITDANQHFHKNVMMGAYKSVYSNYVTISDNEFPTQVSDIGFVDYANGKSDYHNYMLANASQFKNDGSDGKDIGVNLSVLDSALNTIPTDEIILTSPSNNAVNVSVAPTLLWKTAPCNPDYRYEVDNTPVFNSVNLITGLSGSQNTIQVNGLTNSTMYYWRIKALNATDSTKWSSVWQFTTDVSTSLYINNPSSLHVFPNPAHNKVIISGDNLTSISEVSLIDMLGQTLNISVERNTDIICIDLSQLPRGIYLLTYRYEKGNTKFEKILKK